MDQPHEGTAHVRPLGPEESRDVEDILDVSRRFGGYVPTSLRIMARKPNILRAFAGLIQEVMRAPRRGADAAEMARGARGQHRPPRAAIAWRTPPPTAPRAVSPTKRPAIWRRSTPAPAYDPAERALIALALAAGEVPNAATRAHFDALRPHFSEAGGGGDRRGDLAVRLAQTAGTTRSRATWRMRRWPSPAGIWPSAAGRRASTPPTD